VGRGSSAIERKDRLRRRDVIGLIPAAALWPALGLHASENVKVVGVLAGGMAGDELMQSYLHTFREGLGSYGWVEGQNLRFIYRYAGNDPNLMRRGAQELVRLSPDAILALPAPVVPFLQNETKAIPIVFVFVIDAVALGYVASLSAPGGNITGFSNFEPGMGTKWLELLKEIAPDITRVGCMFNPAVDSVFDKVVVDAVKRGGSRFRVEVTLEPVRSDDEIGEAMRSLAGSGGMIVLPGIFNVLHRDAIIAQAAQHRVPTVYGFDFYAQAGGLLSYGEIPSEEFRGAARYVDRILHGTRPSDLPVQLPTKFRLVINARAAKAQGFAISPALLIQADDVIE